MVQVGDEATHNEKEVKTEYPVEEGLTAGTQKQTGRQLNLVPQEYSTISQDERFGMW